MKINGHDIAEKIYTDLRKRVGELTKKGVTPQLVVLLVGNNPGSIAYVNQKELSGAKIGAKVTIKRYEETVSQAELEEELHNLNNDPKVHAILVQRPLPNHIDVNKLELLTNPNKDIDGFHPESHYVLPLPLAIIHLLRYIYDQEVRDEKLFTDWLAKQKIVLLGKGETGGKPILEYLTKLHIHPTVIDSKTAKPESQIMQADIVISAVGKPGIIKAESLKQGVILLGVGMTQGEGRILLGDYKEKEIEQTASYFTPTPRGVGPVNVAMLLENLVTAAERQTQ